MEGKTMIFSSISNNCDNKMCAILQEVDIQTEKINEGTSKMDEITNILSITQMRLNKFKVRVSP